MPEAMRGLSGFFRGAYMHPICRTVCHIKINVKLGSFLEVIAVMLVVWVVISKWEYREQDGHQHFSFHGDTFCV